MVENDDSGETECLKGVRTRRVRPAGFFAPSRGFASVRTNARVSARLREQILLAHHCIQARSSVGLH